MQIENKPIAQKWVFTSFIHLFIYSFIHSFIYSPIHLFIYSSFHLFIYSFIYLVLYNLAPLYPPFIHLKSGIPLKKANRHCIKYLIKVFPQLPLFIWSTNDFTL